MATLKKEGRHGTLEVSRWKMGGVINIDVWWIPRNGDSTEVLNITATDDTEAAQFARFLGAAVSGEKE